MRLPQGIRFQLLILVVLPASILAFSLTFWFVQTRIDELDKTLSERGEIIVKNLSPASLYGIFSGSDYLLQRLTDSIILESDVVDVSIFNKKGQRRAYSKKTNPRDNTPVNELSYFSHPIKLSILENVENDPLSSLIDISKENRQIVGEVRVTLSRAGTLESQREIICTSIIITGLGLLISLLFAYRISRGISDPILALTNTVNQVSKGDLSIRSNINALKELNELKQGLNVMAESLEENQTQLKSKIKSATLDLNHSLHVLESKNRQLNQTRQQAEESSRQKSLFLAHMSHEIRTPMNGILGFLQILGDSSLSPAQSSQLQLIETSASNLLTIINEILDHAELESGNLKLTFSSFDLRQSIEETVALLAPLAHKKRLKLVVLIDEAAPNLLYSDPIRLRQILFNLIGNAIKFAPSGEIIIRLRMQNSSLLFTVSDNGPGIPYKEQQNLFAPFTQIDTAEEFPPPGTGLGLNIAQSIVHALDGEIGFASKETYGTTFWFTLPLGNSDQKPAEKKAQATPPQHAQPKQVLLFDKNRLTQRAIHQQLASIGVISTEINLEGLKKIAFDNELNSYDCIILNGDNNQSIENLENHLPILTLSYTSLKNRNLSNTGRHLQLPCTQTALLEALINSPNRQEPYQSQAHELKIERSNPQPLKFLVADDIEINRLLLIEQIKRHWNASIVEAEDGEEALKTLKRQAFDLVFLDLRMPKKSGLSALKSLMATPGALNQETPFIAITAYLPEDSTEELITAGFSKIILKPSSEKDLVKTVNKLLKLNNKPPRQSGSPPPISQIEERSFFDRLMIKVGGNQKLAFSLLRKLNEDLPQQLEVAQQAFKGGDLNETKEAVHKIHGTARYFEMSELIKQANELETTLTKADLESATALFPLFEKETVQFIVLNQKTIQKPS